jgi:hypothetical protein
MKILCSIIGFLCVVWLGYMFSYQLIDLYEDGRPYRGEHPKDADEREEREVQIKWHKRKTAFKGAIFLGVIWLILYWWPGFLEFHFNNLIGLQMSNPCDTLLG